VRFDAGILVKSDLYVLEPSKNGCAEGFKLDPRTTGRAGAGGASRGTNAARCVVMLSSGAVLGSYVFLARTRAYGTSCARVGLSVEPPGCKNRPEACNGQSGSSQ
jgi:hypothetical protein